MSKKKEKPILSDKIAELMAPRSLLDPEIDSEDETAARAIDHAIDDEFDGEQKQQSLSAIRKRNVKLLHDVDAKYSGRVSSRKELDMDSNESGEEGEEESFAESEKSDSEMNASAKDKSVGEFSMLLTPKQKVAMENGDETNSEDDESDIPSAGESDEEDAIKAFSNKLNKNESTAMESDDEINAMGSDDDEALEKWDDDYEGEEIDEEESTVEDEEGGEEEEDEDESDFDGGDIVPKSSPEVHEESVKVLPKDQSNDHQQKGTSVQNQLQIWEKLLEVRIHSQKMLIKANSLPIYSKFQKLTDNSSEFAELADEAEQNVTKLLSQMNALQTALLAQYPETKKFAVKRKSSSKVIDDGSSDDAKHKRLSENLEEDYSSFKEYQYSVISKWHDRTKILTPGSVKSQQQQANIDILRKIDGVLANREELVKKSQLIKGGYELFDKTERTTTETSHKTADSAEPSKDSEEQIYCSEIYDDADFYHTQLRELIEYKTNTSSSANDMAKQFMELQKLRKKMKKQVDTRASKGRKIRYVVHNKLVSFMAPNNNSDWTDESKTELFKSLFGAQI